MDMNIIKDVVLKNLRGAMYVMQNQNTTYLISELIVVGEFIYVTLINHGISAFRSSDDKYDLIFHINVNCFNVQASSEHLLYYTTDDEDNILLCLHDISDLILNQLKQKLICKMSQQSPVSLHSSINAVIISKVSEAWSSSLEKENNIKVDDSFVTWLELSTLKPIKCWKAANNSISMLRGQKLYNCELLGVLDSRSGLKIYSLFADKEKHVLLYEILIDDVRNFSLLENHVAIFHKFEPNISFWNMKDQKTVLCINIQEQKKEMNEEFLDDDDDEICDAAEDYVTAITDFRHGNDYIIMYGTRSGCIFGMSVLRRCKIFSIPCPHSDSNLSKYIRGIGWLDNGKVVLGYEKYGITILDFSPIDLPPRPPTRGQKRDQ